MELPVYSWTCQFIPHIETAGGLKAASVAIVIGTQIKSAK
jgi:hypothetical protein